MVLIQSPKWFSFTGLLTSTSRTICVSKNSFLICILDVFFFPIALVLRKIPIMKDAPFQSK